MHANTRTCVAADTFATTKRAIGRSLTVACLIAVPGPAATMAADPVIHAAWDESPAPVEGFHYIVTTSSPASPEYPNIELVEGSLTWRIWSVDTDNPDNIGDIGTISCPHADNFAVAILDDSDGPGARDVVAISLVPSSSTKYGTMRPIGSVITGAVLDELTLQADTSANGGEVSLRMSDNVTADITVDKLKSLVSSGGFSGTITVNELTGPFETGVFSGDIEIASATAGYLRLMGLITGSATVSEMASGFFVFNPSGIGQTGEITFGEFLGSTQIDIGTTGLDQNGTLNFTEGLPSGVVVNIDGDLSSTGELLITGDLAGEVNIAGASDGDITISGDSTGSISVTDELLGALDIDGELDGELCASNISADESLPSNITIGSFGSSAEICSVSNSCGGVPSAAAVPTPTQEAVSKSRYLSVVPGNSGTDAAIRVRMTDMPTGYPNEDFSAFNNEVRWAGEPDSYTDVDGTSTFVAAKLQCTPYYTDWSSYGTVHLYGSEIVTGADYDVQLVAESCDSYKAFENNYSTSLGRYTVALLGDITGPSGVPDDQVNFYDISAVVDAFKTNTGAPIKTRAQMQPNVPEPSQEINFNDITKVVDTFKQLAYPFAGPDACE